MINKNVYHVLTDNKAIIADFMSSTYYQLSPVATDIWAGLSKNLSVAEIKADLLQKYDVEEDLLEHDLQLFLKELADKHLISKTDDA